jgi:hypothetical protein
MITISSRIPPATNPPRILKAMMRRFILLSSRVAPPRSEGPMSALVDEVAVGTLPKSAVGGAPNTGAGCDKGSISAGSGELGAIGDVGRVSSVVSPRLSVASTAAGIRGLIGGAISLRSLIDIDAAGAERLGK